ncbi:MAG: transcriptional regulator, partial [Bacteroidetes bacterium]
MSTPSDQLTALHRRREQAIIQIQTLGDFRVWRAGELIPNSAWGRDKTVQLFQFLISARHRHGLHKEQIIDRIWEDADPRSGDQSFKVALHGINKVLEPDRPKRSEPRFIRRQGLTYQLDLTDVWLDLDALEAF